MTQQLRQQQAALTKQIHEQEKAQKREEAEKIAAFRKGRGMTLTVAQIRATLEPFPEGDRALAALEAKGQAIIAREEAEAARPKQPVLIVFADGGKGPKGAAEMKPLVWSALWKGWQGSMNLDDARALARSLGGSVKGDTDGLSAAAE
jgi:hypothetical protein